MPFGLMFPTDPSTPRLFTPAEGDGTAPNLQDEIAKARQGKLTKDQAAGLKRIERGGKLSFGEMWALIASKGAAAPFIQESAHNQIASLEGVIDEKSYPALFDIRSTLMANRAAARKTEEEVKAAARSNELGDALQPEALAVARNPDLGYSEGTQFAAKQALFSGQPEVGSNLLARRANPSAAIEAFSGELDIRKQASEEERIRTTFQYQMDQNAAIRYGADLEYQGNLARANAEVTAASLHAQAARRNDFANLLTAAVNQGLPVQIAELDMKRWDAMSNGKPSPLSFEEEKMRTEYYDAREQAFRSLTKLKTDEQQLNWATSIMASPAVAKLAQTNPELFTSLMNEARGVAADIFNPLTGKGNPPPTGAPGTPPAPASSDTFRSSPGFYSKYVSGVNPSSPSGPRSIETRSSSVLIDRSTGRPYQTPPVINTGGSKLIVNKRKKKNRSLFERTE